RTRDGSSTSRSASSTRSPRRRPSSPSSAIFFLSRSGARRDLHPFPTRRSSDLNFGMKMLTMTNLSTECLIQLTKLGYDATPFNQILKQNAKREMRLRLGKVTVADVLAAQPVTTNLLKFMRASIKMIG